MSRRLHSDFESPAVHFASRYGSVSAFPDTGLSPLQFVTRERITRAAVFYFSLSTSYFSSVFRRVACVTPREFRGAL